MPEIELKVGQIWSAIGRYHKIINIENDMMCYNSYYDEELLECYNVKISCSYIGFLIWAKSAVLVESSYETVEFIEKKNRLKSIE